jgi:hypothetical protein
MNDGEEMIEALEKACRLDNQEACRELQSFPSIKP